MLADTTASHKEDALADVYELILSWPREDAAGEAATAGAAAAAAAGRRELPAQAGAQPARSRDATPPRPAGTEVRP